jgi:hypothetical protein
MSEVKVAYALQRFPAKEKTIYLAGPAPGNRSIRSWRYDALSLIAKFNFKGVVIVPEPEPEAVWVDYPSMVEWEEAALEAATCVLFWIPRTGETPAIDVNVDWGMTLRSGKVVLGYPSEALEIRRVAYMASKYKVPTAHTLPHTVYNALKMLKVKDVDALAPDILPKDDGGSGGAGVVRYVRHRKGQKEYIPIIKVTDAESGHPLGVPANDLIIQLVLALTRTMADNPEFKTELERLGLKVERFENDGSES